MKGKKEGRGDGGKLDEREGDERETRGDRGEENWEEKEGRTRDRKIGQRGRGEAKRRAGRVRLRIENPGKKFGGFRAEFGWRKSEEIRQ